jgi:hypothetical protein
MYRGGTIAYFHHLDFQSKNVSYAIFIVKKRPLYVNLSIPLCGNWWFSQGSTPCVGMRFFWTPKDCCPPFVGAKKTFSSTLNVMISQIVRNESVIFGRHIDIEVSYKILQLEVPKLVPLLHYLACFQKGLFGGNFEQKHPQAFRG